MLKTYRASNFNFNIFFYNINEYFKTDTTYIYISSPRIKRPSYMVIDIFDKSFQF